MALEKQQSARDCEQKMLCKLDEYPCPPENGSLSAWNRILARDSDAMFKNRDEQLRWTSKTFEEAFQLLRVLSIRLAAVETYARTVQVDLEVLDCIELIKKPFEDLFRVMQEAHDHGICTKVSCRLRCIDVAKINPRGYFSEYEGGVPEVYSPRDLGTNTSAWSGRLIWMILFIPLTVVLYNVACFLSCLQQQVWGFWSLVFGRPGASVVAPLLEPILAPRTLREVPDAVALLCLEQGFGEINWPLCPLVSHFTSTF